MLDVRKKRIRGGWLKVNNKRGWGYCYSANSYKKLAQNL